MFCASESIDITPGSSVQLAGYFNRKGPSQGIAQTLEANAVLLNDGLKSVLFISADLLYFGKELSDFVLEDVVKYGLTPESLVLTASHTHFAPATDFGKPGLGTPDSIYMEYLKSQLSILIAQVFSAQLEKVRLSHSSLETDLNVNRRRRWRWPTVSRAGIDFSSKVLMAPNVHAGKDDLVDVLRVESEATGKLVAVFWKFACHPVGYPDRNFVTSEYPGVCRESLRAHVGFKMPVVFWQGFAGDVRPMLEGKPKRGDLLKAWLRGPGFRQATKVEWDVWVHKLADVLVAVLNSPARNDVKGELSLASERIPLFEVLNETEGSGQSVALARVAVEGSIELIFISAEVCSPYLKTLSCRRARTVFVGYAGDVFGYLPSEEQVVSKGYEGHGFLSFFGYKAGFCSGFEQRVCDAVNRMRFG